MSNHFHLVVETPQPNLVFGMEERVGPNHYGAERRETGVQKAERIVREELMGSQADQVH